MGTFDGWALIIAAVGPFATGVLAWVLKRSETHKMRTLNEVVEQVKPNGGSSLRDAIDRIEKLAIDLTSRVEQLEAERVRRNRWRG